MVKMKVEVDDYAILNILFFTFFRSLPVFSPTQFLSFSFSVFLLISLSLPMSLSLCVHTHA